MNQTIRYLEWYNMSCVCARSSHTYYNQALPARGVVTHISVMARPSYTTLTEFMGKLVASSLYSYHGHGVGANAKGKGGGNILLNNIRMTHFQCGDRDFVHRPAL